MTSVSPFRIGTRGSPLALAQAEEVKARLIATFPDMAELAEIVIIKTTGDMVQDRALAE
ncbi:MAG TPA: hydroxymethylbilane synthase, partial [Rhodospirillales bacterium]|nr:hydroxymethylbilane synthase [Rhodospirillales bacterium]